MTTSTGNQRGEDLISKVTLRRAVAFFKTHQRPILIVLLLAGLGLFLALIPGPTLQTISRGLRQAPVALLLLALFSAITLSLLFATGQQADTWVLLLLNERGRRPRWLDIVMVILTQLGGGWPSLSLGAILYLSGGSNLGIRLILGTISLWLVVETVKTIVDRTRPYGTLEAVRLVGMKALGRSFPSGHTAQAFFVASLFIQYFSLSTWSALGLYTIAGLVGFTRIYIGVHYPRDVLAGAMLGMVWGLLSTLTQG